MNIEQDNKKNEHVDEITEREFIRLLLLCKERMIDQMNTIQDQILGLDGIYRNYVRDKEDNILHYFYDEEKQTLFYDKYQKPKIGFNPEK